MTLLASRLTLLLLVAAPAGAQGTSARATAPVLAGEVRQVGAERPVLDAWRAEPRGAARVRLDGRLDDEAWRSAQVAGGFRQRMPAEGAAASRATRVRVLADDEALYVGATFDEAPDSLSAPLGRRDAHPPSDEFLVYLDTQRDGRTAFVFAVTPSGVRSDARLVGGALPDPTWDGVWDSAVARDSTGWSAELRIPLAQLPFAGARDGAPLAWGVEFERVRNLRGETSQWALVPQTAPIAVAHYGVLRVPVLGAVRGRLQVTPYALARATRLAPADANALVPRAGGAATTGADVRFAVSSAFALTAAVNPDFGQVEADSAAVNLSALELFLPERRPFFVAGSDLFRLTMNRWYDGTSELFYSRRIGRRPTLDTPDAAVADDRPASSTILGAAKLTGRTRSGWSVGVLDAHTREVRAAWMDASGARHASVVEPATNTAVARVTRDFRGGRTVFGLMGTAVTRDLDSATARELRRAAFTGGIDVLHRAGGYEAQAIAAASDVRGSREAILATQESGVHFFQRPGAPHLGVDSSRTSLGGWATSARVAKVGGNFHWELGHRAYSPGYEPNDAGFLAQADQRLAFAHLDYTRPVRDGTRLRRWWLATNLWDYRDFSGARTDRLTNVVGYAQLRNFWGGWLYGGQRGAGMAPELLQGGPALRRAPRLFYGGWLESDARRALSFGSGVERAQGRDTDYDYTMLSARLTARPSGRLEVTVGPSFETLRDPVQYVDAADAPDGRRWVLGSLDQRTASLTARAVLAFTPTLTLQGYAQPFVSVGRFGALAEVGDPTSPQLAAPVAPLPAHAVTPVGDRLVVRADDPARRYTIDRPDFAMRSMNGNAVLRWDYRPGSALFVVWSHTRGGDDAAERAAAGRLDDGARRLWSMAGTNEIIVKFSRAFAW